MTTPAPSHETPDPDPARQWHEAMERVCALVEAKPAEDLEQRVPACPDWSARELLAHMVGLGADLLDGEEPEDHHESWTQAQVDARADRDTDALVAEWRALADDLVAHMRREGPRPLADVVIHEQDLREALAEPGGADSAGVATVRGWFTQRFGAAVEALPAIALVGTTWTWCSTGEARDAAVQVSASDLDLFRALTSRRTAEQIRGWTTRGDVEAYLEAFAGLGPLPEEPVSGEHRPGA